MKTIKKITSVFVFLFFAQIILFAQKSSTGNVNQIAAGIVEKLDKDVALTDSQKVLILEHAKAFAAKSQSTKNMANNDATRSQRRNHVQEYKSALNSILTDEQKELIVKKRQERREAAIEKYTSSQK